MFLHRMGGFYGVNTRNPTLICSIYRGVFLLTFKYLSMIQKMMNQRESLEIVYPEVAKAPLPAFGEVEAILTRFKAGEKGADEELKRVCCRFVASVAKQYVGQGVSKEELLEVGTKGLLKAAQQYDTNGKTKFICYAIWWIRQSIILLVNEHAK